MYIYLVGGWYDVVGEVGEGPADLCCDTGYQAKSNLQHHHDQDVGEPGATETEPAAVGIGVG